MPSSANSISATAASEKGEELKGRARALNEGRPLGLDAILTLEGRLSELHQALARGAVHLGVGAGVELPQQLGLLEDDLVDLGAAGLQTLAEAVDLLLGTHPAAVIREADDLFIFVNEGLDIMVVVAQGGPRDIGANLNRAPLLPRTIGGAPPQRAGKEAYELFHAIGGGASGLLRRPPGRGSRGGGVKGRPQRTALGRGEARAPAGRRGSAGARRRRRRRSDAATDFLGIPKAVRGEEKEEGVEALGVPARRLRVQHLDQLCIEGVGLGKPRGGGTGPSDELGAESGQPHGSVVDGVAASHHDGPRAGDAPLVRRQLLRLGIEWGREGGGERLSTHGTPGAFAPGADGVVIS